MNRQRLRLRRSTACLICVAALLGIASSASAYWYWYTTAGQYGGVAAGDTRNSGYYNGYMGEATNETSGTAKWLYYERTNGTGQVSYSATTGNPKQFKFYYSGGSQSNVRHFCKNVSSGAASLKCGWNTDNV